MTEPSAVATNVNELESGLTTKSVAPLEVTAIAELERLIAPERGAAPWAGAPSNKKTANAARASRRRDLTGLG